MKIALNSLKAQILLFGGTKNGHHEVRRKIRMDEECVR